MSIATASDFEIAPARPLLRPLISAAACVAPADWLFYGWQIGISLALFFGVLGAIAVAGNRGRATRNNQIAMSALFVAGLLPLIESVNVLSVIVSALATALFVIVCLSHAEYAHRGAYPLIVTALLAAGFVLIAMRPGGPAEKSRLIRPLVLVWTGQNILLVVSSILRLDLYVAAFSLTYLRLAAFIWMCWWRLGCC